VRSLRIAFCSQREEQSVYRELIQDLEGNPLDSGLPGLLLTNWLITGGWQFRLLPEKP